MKTHCYLYALALCCLSPLTAQAEGSLTAPVAGVYAPQAENNIYKVYAQRFADSEMKRFPEAWQLDHGKRLFFGYAQGVGCCAMLDMWRATGERRYFDYVEQWADSLINDKGEIHLYNMSDYNLDFINSGKVLFALYKETGKEKYKQAMDVLIRQLSRHPRTTDGGFWHKLVYQHQMWLDGIYMASPFMAEYGATFNQPQWIDEAVRQIRVCHKHTFDARTGLYYHAWDESKNQRWANSVTGQSPNFWGRSIGWWFMALVDVLDFVPADLIAYVQGVAASLPYYQDKDGLWYQVIDRSGDEGNYLESSVSTMFIYTLYKGVRLGLIDPTYLAVAEKGYQGVLKHFIEVDENGVVSLTQTCAVAGLGGNPYRSGDYDYYIHEKVRANDPKAVGPFINASLERERLKEKR